MTRGWGRGALGVLPVCGDMCEGLEWIGCMVQLLSVMVGRQKWYGSDCKRLSECGKTTLSDRNSLMTIIR